MTTPKFLAGFLVAGITLLTIQATATAQSASKPLKGGVSETGRVERRPGLTRQDLGDDDPFAKMQDEALTPSKDAFKAPPSQKPTKPFGLQAQQGGFQGAPQNPLAAPDSMDGIPDEMPPQPQAPPQPPQPTYNPNDPDSSPDMQLAWDQWHKRVAATIFDRFNFFAKAAFKRSPPLLAEVGYVVSRDGHIQNISVRRKSANVLFNVLIYQSVKSLDGDLSVLSFPQGSRRMYVQKFGTFTQNYGPEGFRYTINDKEMVKQ